MIHNNNEDAMGYFSNSDEGTYYESRYCERCVHSWHTSDDGPLCPVWELHLSLNYEQYDKGQENLRYALDTLIPREGAFNAQCQMFVPQTQRAPSLPVARVVERDGRSHLEIGEE